MGNVLKRYHGTSWEVVGGTVTGDTLPIGSEVDYTGTDIPAGWEEVPSYSTSEVNTGQTWINGKPLYRKTFTFTINHTSSTSTVANNIEHHIDNVDTIFIDQGHSFFTDGATDYVLGRAYISSKAVIASFAAVVTTTNIRTEIFLESNASFDFTITLNYTKTTD